MCSFLLTAVLTLLFEQDQHGSNPLKDKDRLSRENIEDTEKMHKVETVHFYLSKQHLAWSTYDSVQVLMLMFSLMFATFV